jgi:ribonuclease P protein component
MGEATVPAEQPAAGQAAWVPAPDVDASRPRHPQGAPGQGTRPPVGLTWRVTDQATFRSFRHAPRARSGPLTVVFVAGDAPGTPPRVAYAIAKRVGNAVTRNRLRRRLRAVTATAGLAPGAWLVIAGPEAATAGVAELSEWLSTAAERAARTEAAS